jgi:hypothetical protein
MIRFIKTSLKIGFYGWGNQARAAALPLARRFTCWTTADKST